MNGRIPHGLTAEEWEAEKAVARAAIVRARKVLKIGDKVRFRECAGTHTLTILEFDLSGIVYGRASSCHPINIFKVNGKSVDFSQGEPV